MKQELLATTLILTVLMCSCASNISAYQIPELNFEKLPFGFRISIPDEKGVVRVAFNVNRNRPFEAFEQGDFSEQIRHPVDGKFVYEVKRQLETDDVLYVWLSVQFENLIYRKIAPPISIQNYNHTDNSDRNEGNSIDQQPRPSATEREPLPNELCVQTETKITTQGTRKQPRCRDELIFNEEFNNNALDENLWTTEIRLPSDSCEDEFVVYNASNIELRNNQLTFRATLWNENRPGTELRQGLLDLGDKCTEALQEYCRRRPHGAMVLPPTVSGRITTKSHFSFQYGRVVVRAKFPKGDWLYPLLLLEPALILLNDPLPCFNVRVAFARGNEHLTNLSDDEDIGACRLVGGVIFTGTASNRNQFMAHKTSREAFNNDFHIYELVWNEEFLIFKVDDEEYGHIKIADLSSPEEAVNQNIRSAHRLLNREFALTLGLAVGGHADFPDGVHNKPWTNTAPKAALHFWQKRNTWLGSWTDSTLQIDYVHEDGVQGVLYAIELNEQCPALFDYIKSPQNKYWTMTRSEPLRIGDRLTVSVMVQHENNVYNRNENFDIGDSGQIFATSPDILDNALSSFDQCELKRRCEQSATEFGGANFCRDALIFEDDFNEAPLLSKQKWTYDISLRVNGDGDEEFVMFENKTDTTYIKDGVLYIRPKITGAIDKGNLQLQGCTSKDSECYIKADGSRKFLPPVRSAQISTEPSFAFKYGRIEIRAKLPKGDWIFPRLMLRTVDDEEPRIRIAFALGNQKLLTDQSPREQIGGEVLMGGIIVWRPVKDIFGRNVKQATLKTISHKSSRHYGEEFHTYTLIWNRTSLTFGVDGNNYGTINQELSGKYYIQLGVSIGGHVFFPDNSANLPRTNQKPWKNTDPKAVFNFLKHKNDWLPSWEPDNSLQVDYVRVFAL